MQDAIESWDSLADVKLDGPRPSRTGRGHYAACCYAPLTSTSTSAWTIFIDRFSSADSHDGLVLLFLSQDSPSNHACAPTPVRGCSL